MNQIIQKAVEELSSEMVAFEETTPQEDKALKRPQMITAIFTQKLTEAYMAGRSEERTAQVGNLRGIVELLEAMYGRLGIGAVYDTIRDCADRLEKEPNLSIKGWLLKRAKQPPTQGCCEKCLIKVAEGVCADKTCSCHSVKDNN